MTATTRTDTRPPVLDEGERETLLSFLRYLREAVIGKALGLAGEQARTPGVPSGTSLLGLVRHLAVAETYWFEEIYAGLDVGALDFSMDLAAGDTEESVVAAYREAARRSDAIIAAAASVTAPAARATGPTTQPRSLRWILVHMIEETARHAGHADILRERIDGATGR
ncbi:DinB family protein [Kitasatospora sp. NPDC049285]|uniref:DinB family protein n=1 Tax=Kitasatospora sp. NPDC049285 TaxID=3157096 RepID=UPI003413ADB9